MVLLEAAAGGLTVVTTRVGGTAEVVLDGESGYLAPPGDSPALASAMMRLMHLGQAERRALGERGREHIRTNYGLHRVVERWEELYREVLAEKAARRQGQVA